MSRISCLLRMPAIGGMAETGLDWLAILSWAMTVMAFSIFTREFPFSSLVRMVPLMAVPSLGDRSDAEAFRDFRARIDEGPEEIFSVVFFTNGTELGADVGSYSMHGVTALALGDSVPVEGRFPFGGIAAGFTEDGPLGKGFILGKGEAELSEGIFDLWGFGRFRSGDDIEREIGIEFSGGEFSQLGRDDFSCLRFVESAQSLNGELLLGEGRFFVLEGVGEEIEGLFARIEEEKKGAGPAADLVVFVGDEGG